MKGATAGFALLACLAAASTFTLESDTFNFKTNDKVWSKVLPEVFKSNPLPTKGPKLVRAPATCSADPDVIFIKPGRGKKFKSPNFPEAYPNNADCSFEFETAEGYILEMKCKTIKIAPRDSMVLIDPLNDSEKIYEDVKLKDEVYRYSGNKGSVSLVTNRRGGRKGFKCRMNSVPASPPTPPPPSGDCNCGVEQETRIVGGQQSAEFKYPYIVALGDNTFCGGSLISNEWVVTAAHCVPDIDTVTLKFGQYSWLTESTYTIERESITITSHPDYDDDTYDNDIALVRFAPAIDWAEHPRIRPVCLPSSDTNDYVDVNATVIGWGRLTSGGDFPEFLQEVHVPVISNEECAEMYVSEPITDNMICAYEEGKDSCQGDSGGPMTQTEDGHHELIGVVSWGIGCAEYPGVYARVTEYLEWIDSTVGNTGYCSPPTPV